MHIANVKDRKLSIADLLDLRALMGGNILAAASLETAIRGFEEGYNEVEDLITETKDGFPLNGMWAEFQKVIGLWNAQRDALTNLLTFNVTTPIEGVRYPVEQDFQEATEFGEPTGIRLGPAIRHGYPFKWYDLAIRYTWQFLADVTQAQLVALNNTALEADNRLYFTKIMARLFSNTTSTADIDGDALNVYGFYNGDSQVPPKWKTTTFTSGHQHYLSSGAATIDSGDLDTLIHHIAEHGYSQIRGYKLVVMVNEQEADVIRGFNTADGDKFTFIPSNAPLGGRVLDVNGGVVGAPEMTSFPGLLTIGSYGSAVIIQEEYIPAGWVVAFATGGADNIGNPVGIRQHETASLQGLKLVKGRTPDYPLIDSFYIHGFGCGVRHRGAGAVMKIAAGAYSVPPQYA
jgi:hypothetical protein